VKKSFLGRKQYADWEGWILMRRVEGSQNQTRSGPGGKKGRFGLLFDRQSVKGGADQNLRKLRPEVDRAVGADRAKKELIVVLNEKGSGCRIFP